MGAVAPGGGADGLAGVQGGVEPLTGLEVEAVVEPLAVQVRGVDLGSPGGIVLDPDPSQKGLPEGQNRSLGRDRLGPLDRSRTPAPGSERPRSSRRPGAPPRRRP